VSTVNQLVNGHRRVSAKIAIKLAAAFGNEPHEWMHFQTDHDLSLAREAEIWEADE
jgi:addiction module HigA family antidote